MKHIMVFALFISASMNVYSQKRLNLGGGLVYDNYKSPGVFLNLEYENYFTSEFSSPLKFEMDMVYGTEVNSFSLEIHKGFRKYFNSGLFVEQYIGLGAMANFYKTDDIWYFDQYDWGYRYSPGANWGFKPSVGLVIGYDLTKNSDKQNLISIKPDIYWNLGYRPLYLPYTSIQVSYTFNLKTL